MVRRSTQSGLVKFLMIIIVIVLILSFFKVNLRGFVDDSRGGAFKHNIEIVVELASRAWTDYIHPLFSTIWNDYVEPFMKGEFLQGIREKQLERSVLPTDVPSSTPSVEGVN